MDALLTYALFADSLLLNAPLIDAPLIDAPLIDAPLIDAPLIDAPLIDAPLIDAPLIDAPLIDALSIGALIMTVLHAALTAVLVIGVLFSSTRIQHIALLSTLLILLFGIRLNRGCCLTFFEGQPTLSQIGKAMYLQHDEPSLSDKTFEEILVSNLAFFQIIRIVVLSILPVKEVFES